MLQVPRFSTAVMKVVVVLKDEKLELHEWKARVEYASACVQWERKARMARKRDLLANPPVTSKFGMGWHQVI